MNLRPRNTQPFSGFTKAEVMKMELLLNESEEQSLEILFFKSLANDFNRSVNRAGKPCVKWTEVLFSDSYTTRRSWDFWFGLIFITRIKYNSLVIHIQSWFEKNRQNCLFKDTSFGSAKKSPLVPESLIQDIATDNPKMPEGVKCRDVSEMELEARSTDGAWYDVDKIISHRVPSPGEFLLQEVCVRYVGFGAEYDEWVDIKNNLRELSVTFDDSECQKVKAGDLVVCFQESKHQARYYDAHVMDIQRKVHDVRGCRCLFLIRYDHDNTQERVRLQRLCGRPKH